MDGKGRKIFLVEFDASHCSPCLYTYNTSAYVIDLMVSPASTDQSITPNNAQSSKISNFNLLAPH